jgi:predicted nucleic acid-binding protein
MKLYLDNCCFNRPFDNQAIVKNRLETEAKLHIQSQIEAKEHQLIWSDILEYENSVNPYEDRRSSTLKWKSLAIYCQESERVLLRAESLTALGIRTKDALHIAYAIEANADYLLTTDAGMLNKDVEGIKIIKPLDFVRKEADR